MWFGLAWLWLPSSYSILNIRCSKMPRQCDKRKICKAQSKHQFYVSSFLLCSIHFIWFIRLYCFNGGCHLTTERDHPKCKKAQMISHKRFKCVWVCMKYSDANEIDKRKAHIMAPPRYQGYRFHQHLHHNWLHQKRFQSLPIVYHIWLSAHCLNDMRPIACLTRRRLCPKK